MFDILLKWASNAIYKTVSAPVYDIGSLAQMIFHIKQNRILYGWLSTAVFNEGCAPIAWKSFDNVISFLWVVHTKEWHSEVSNSKECNESYVCVIWK